MLKLSKFACLLVLSGLSFSQTRPDPSEILPTPVCFDGKTVYINSLGEIVLRTNFDYFFLHNHSFSEGLAGFEENGKFGFIDKTGTVVIKPAFDYVDDFSEGFAEIEIKDKTGFIDKQGIMIVPPFYNKAFSFTNGFAAVAIENGYTKYGYVKYKWGFIDKTGDVVVGKSKNKRIGRFDDAESFSEGLAAVKIGRKWGFVNEKDRIVIKLRFKEVRPFSEDLAAATIDGKTWGFIDKKGQFVIKPQFSDAVGFSEGLAAVSAPASGDWGFIDTTGQFVIQPSFHSKPGEFYNGYSLLFFGTGGFGYSDRTGKVVNKRYVGGASNFVNGVAWIYPNEYGENFVKYGGGYIDEQGNYIWNPKEKNKMFGSKCN